MMILQANTSDFPRYSDRVLFVLGLGIYTLGQVLINLGQGFVERQTPVDFAHWFLLIGGLFLLPFVGRLPRRNIHLITIPVLIAGIAFMIGMNVLDFIFWSLPNDEFEAELARRLIDTPVIWQPFITIGPNYVFTTGLVLPCLSYFKVSRTGVLLVIGGSLIMLVGTQWFNVVGYLVMIAGYVLCFDRLRPAPPA
jgi:hypothetical protein